MRVLTATKCHNEFKFHQVKIKSISFERSVVIFMIDERKKLLLRAVIDEYISTAEPVGSKSLALKYELSLSSATIRNELAELEALGYLEKPYTSAGRIPSHKGYRLYVNELKAQQTLTPLERFKMSNAVSVRLNELEQLKNEAGKILSELTRYASLFIPPTLNNETFNRFEVIRISEERMVFILVTGSSIVKDKISRAGKIDDDKVQRAVILINGQLSGILLCDISLEHLIEIEKDFGGRSDFLDAVFDFFREVVSDFTIREIKLDGTENLLNYPEYRDTVKLKSMLEFMRGISDTKWLSLPEGGNMVVNIGEENSAIQLKDASVIITPCTLFGNAKGYIGVVGPTRMNYARMMAVVKFFAEIINNLGE